MLNDMFNKLNYDLMIQKVDSDDLNQSSNTPLFTFGMVYVHSK